GVGSPARGHLPGVWYLAETEDHAGARRGSRGHDHERARCGAEGDPGCEGGGDHDGEGARVMQLVSDRPLTLAKLEETGALREVAARLTTSEDALFVFSDLPLDAVDVRRFPAIESVESPLSYWRDVARELERHRYLERFMDEAAR